ncbi:MAG: hypothetical protein ACE5ER_11290 [Nitrospinaceae bacterium]
MNRPLRQVLSGALVMILMPAFLTLCTTAVLAQMDLEMDGLEINGLDLDNLDIDEVMQSLDRDFTFGDREVVKRENLSVTVEAQQEDNQTRQEVVRTRLQDLIKRGVVKKADVPPQFTLVEFFLENNNSAAGDSLDFFVPGFPPIATGFTGNTFTSVLLLPTQRVQKLAVQCNGSKTLQCLVQVGILQGARFTSLTMGIQKVPIGTTLFIPFDVF